MRLGRWFYNVSGWFAVLSHRRELEQDKQQVRAASAGGWFQTLRQDLRLSLRLLGKSPEFAVTSILTLSLGIAATVAIFGFVDSALIRPLPYPNLSRLIGGFRDHRVR